MTNEELEKKAEEYALAEWNNLQFGKNKATSIDIIEAAYLAGAKKRDRWWAHRWRRWNICIQRYYFRVQSLIRPTGIFRRRAEREGC